MSSDNTTFESLVLQALDFPACLKDSQGALLSCNDAYRNFETVLHEDSALASFLNTLENATFKSQSQQEAELGTHYKVNCRLVSYQQQPAVISIFHDYSEINALEATLADSQGALKNYLEHSFEMITRIDLLSPLDSRWPINKQVEHFIENAVIGDCNDYYARFYGFDGREDMIGAILPYFNSQDEYRVAAKSLAEGRFKVTQQKLLQHNINDGSDLWVEYSTRAIWEGDLFFGFWATQRDISELVEQQSELQIRDERYRDFVANSSDAVARVDLVPPVSMTLPTEEQVVLIANSLRIVECNENWAKQYKTTIEDIVGRLLLEIEPIEELFTQLRYFIGNAYSVRHIKQSVTLTNGDVKWLRYSATPIVDGSDLLGVWYTQEDITELEVKKIDLEKSESLHREFFISNFTPVIRFRLDRPMPLTLPAEEQLSWLVNHVRVYKVNLSLVSWVGHSDPADIEGYLLKDLNISSSTDVLIWKEFIEENYHLKSREWHVNNEAGLDIHFISEHRGTIENDHLTEVWATYQDRTEAKKSLQQLEYQAHHDDLTKLPNRIALHNFLNDQLCGNSAENQVLLFIDLDLFKEVNDALGHHSGDLLLNMLGPRLQSVTNHYRNSIVARLGGDEFAVSAAVTDVEAANRLAEKLLSVMKEAFDLDGVNVHVSGSIGFAMSPQDSSNIKDLMRYADVAMYRAKSTGIGFAHYNTDKDQQSSRRLELMSELRAAVEKNDEQLQLYYQPKIDLNTHQCHGVEALMRWRHPSYGFINPGEFIPIAESTDLIHKLTEWVLNRALEEWRPHWQKNRITVAVNFSARNLLNPNVIDMTRAALKRHDMPGQALEVEITESTLMQNPTQAQLVVEEMRSLGISIAIDDFGTGYSSLAYLKNLPVNVLKIDYSFVRDILFSAEDKVIVSSVIQLAHNFGLKVVAEGVESSDVQVLLKEMDCNLVQGFHIAKPMPIKDFVEWHEKSLSQ